MAGWCLGTSVLILCLSACGGSEEEDADAGLPDAESFDAPPVEQLSVTIDGVTVCPEGWTTGPTAVGEDVPSQVRIRAACSTDIEEVLILFNPRPENPGDTASCFESTYRINGGSRVRCRVNNAVLNDPVGELALSTTTPPRVSGSCDCSGEDGGNPVSGSATFDLSLQ